MVAAILLSACAALQRTDPLQVTVAGIEPMQVQGMESHAGEAANHNLNDAPIEYDGVSLKIDVQGKIFATGVSDESGSVPRFGESVISVPVTTSAMRMVGQALGMGEKKIEKINYSLTGKLNGPVFSSVRFETREISICRPRRRRASIQPEAVEERRPTRVGVQTAHQRVGDRVREPAVIGRLGTFEPFEREVDLAAVRVDLGELVGDADRVLFPAAPRTPRPTRRGSRVRGAPARAPSGATSGSAPARSPPARRAHHRARAGCGRDSSGRSATQLMPSQAHRLGVVQGVTRVRLSTAWAFGLSGSALSACSA